MKKFAYVVAALVGIAVAAPTIASAQSVVIRTGHDHMDRHHRGHDGWRRHEGWRHHRHHHHDRVVVIKKHRY